jgi:hypothetical protein
LCSNNNNNWKMLTFYYYLTLDHCRDNYKEDKTQKLAGGGFGGGVYVWAYVSSLHKKK